MPLSPLVSIANGWLSFRKWSNTLFADEPNLSSTTIYIYRPQFWTRFYILSLVRGLFLEKGVGVDGVDEDEHGVSFDHC